MNKGIAERVLGEERDIDQVHCNECGRPMIIFVDDPRKVFVCTRCKSGKTPEWEY